MKLVITILCVLACVLSEAQLIRSTGKKWNSKEILDKISDSTVYFLDTRIVKKDSIKVIKPIDIASITAYFEDEPGLQSIYRAHLEHGAIVFFTKRFAISTYRPELSKISNEYSELTKLHPDDRDCVLYIVEGDTLKPNVEGKLMNIDFKRIDRMEVIFPDDTQKVFGDRTRFGVVIINSRKD
jgi:hypothetical protein